MTKIKSIDINPAFARELYREFHCYKVAVVFDTEKECGEAIDFCFKNPELRGGIRIFADGKTIITTKIWAEAMKEQGLAFTLQYVSANGGLSRKEFERFKKKLSKLNRDYGRFF